jgi:hypothetical protein
MCDYKTPTGDLGLLASANRAMSAQLTSIRGALDGAMRAAGDLPERIRMLVSENANLRAYLVAHRDLLAEKDAEIESLRGSIEPGLDFDRVTEALSVPHHEPLPAQGPADVNVRGWQPIETAPRDGTAIELLGENGKLDLGAWNEWSEHFDKGANGIDETVTGEFSTEYGEGPHTHWRPLTTSDEVPGAPAGAEG